MLPNILAKTVDCVRRYDAGPTLLPSIVVTILAPSTRSRAKG